MAHQIEAPAGSVPQSPGREIALESRQTNPLSDTMSSEIQSILFRIENCQAYQPRSSHARHFQNTSQLILLLTPGPVRTGGEFLNLRCGRIRFPRPRSVMMPTHSAVLPSRTLLHDSVFARDPSRRIADPAHDIHCSAIRRPSVEMTCPNRNLVLRKTAARKRAATGGSVTGSG